MSLPIACGNYGMDPMNKLMPMLATAVLGSLMLIAGLLIAIDTADGAGPKALACDNTAATAYTGTYKRVTVAAGASCYLRGASVFSIHAKDPRNVYVIDTEVTHNIHVMGATDNVVIGTSGCSYDPHAGNNIHVQKSHNVAICWESVDNNIQVFQNDGRIMLKHNTAGNNIMVQNNYPYVRRAGDGVHRRLAAIRFYFNTAGNHNFVRHNSNRQVIARHNNPTVE